MIILETNNWTCGEKSHITTLIPWILQKLNQNSVEFWKKQDLLTVSPPFRCLQTDKKILPSCLCDCHLLLLPPGFFVCGLNLTLPEDSTIFRYVLWPRENFTKVIRRSLPELLQWVRQQTGRSPNIIASDVVTRDNFVATVVQLNHSKNK